VTATIYSGEEAVTAVNPDENVTMVASTEGDLVDPEHPGYQWYRFNQG